MNHVKVLACTLAACGGLFASHHARAQSLNVPTGYMWSSEIPSGFSFSGNPMIKRMIHLNLAYDIYYNPAETGAGFKPDLLTVVSSGETGAFLAGRAAAKRMAYRNVAAPNAFVLLQNFGREDVDPEDTHNCNFYRPEDRLLPVSHEYEATDPFRYPVPRSLVNPDVDKGTARTFRHPFLVNAGFNIDENDIPNLEPATSPPLKKWMEEFCAGYKAEQAEQYNTSNVDIPDPAAFPFDTEVAVVPSQHQNFSHTVQIVASDYKRWSTWPVPGYGGATLKDLYDLRVADPAYNWPADDLSNPQNPQAGLLVSNFRVGYGNDDDNREFMIWWSEICARALGEVMKFSAYDVIHANFPNAKCGNYREFAADGSNKIGTSSTEDRIQWFQDRPLPPTDDPNDPDYFDPNMYFFPRDFDQSGSPAPSVSNERLPRFALDKNLGGILEFGEGDQRYLGYPMYRTGDIDCPVLYPSKECDNDDYRIQKDYYRWDTALADYPLTTTTWESTRLIARRDVETAINSNNVSSSNEAAMVPWILMPYTQDVRCNPVNPASYYEEKEFRELMGMLRGKNISTCLFWTDVGRSDGEVEQAWDMTAEWFPRVYATKVKSYTRQSGAITIPPEMTLARLEFTLPQPGNLANREYAVELTPSPPPTGSTEYISSLVVDFEWTGTEYLDNTMADIAIESTVNVAGVTGEVYYWGLHTNGSPAWIPLRTLNCPHGVTDTFEYEFHAPESADNLYRSRARFIDTPIRIFDDGTIKKTRLKLVHRKVGGSFTSRYDLVQLTPTGIACLPVDEEQALRMPQADANHDGTISPDDFDAFAERWFSESAAADLNLNGELDEGDIDTFEDAYLTGT